MKKIDLDLNDVDIELLEQLDLIVDIFISTYSKIGITVKKMSSIINDKIKTWLVNHKNWSRYEPKSYDILYRPFYSDAMGTKKAGIDYLEQYFNVDGNCLLIKKEGSKEVNHFFLTWGYEYNVDDNKEQNFYFYFVQWDALKKPVILFNLNSIEKLLIASKLKFNVLHPDKGDADAGIYILLNKNDYQKIGPAFNFYAFKLLPILLNSIE